MKEYSVQEHLESLGFGSKLNEAISFYVDDKPTKSFQLPIRERNDKEAVDYWFYFKEKDRAANYELARYEVHLRIYPEIPGGFIFGTDITALSNKMKAIDWSMDYHTYTMIDHLSKTKEGNNKLNSMDEIFAVINKLHELPEGKNVAELLMYRYWSGGPYEPNTFPMDHLQSKYEYMLSIPSGIIIKKDLAYEMVHEVAKKSNQLIINNQKTNFMNEDNFEFLQNNIKYMGFSENLNEQLEKNLKQGKDDFELSYKTEINKKPFEATLKFGKADNSDMYFFNNYKATLERSNGQKVDQTFYLNKGKGVTAKEAFNMLDGRAVHKQLTNKDNEPYKAWLQLDFKNKDKHDNFEVKQYHENYGYDLKAELKKYGIAELNDDTKEKSLMQSLQRGNVQSVSIDKDGTAQKMFVEANPQFKAITLYDSQMNRVQKENIEQFLAEKQGNGKDMKQGQKEGLKNGNENNQDNKSSEKKIRRVGQRV